MATQPLTPDAGSVTLPRQIPPMPAVAQILGRFDRSTLECFLSVAVDLLDTLDGDADDEEPADLEASDGDDQDVSWTEWQSRGRHKHKTGVLRASGELCAEDDEEDDGDCALDEGEPNFRRAIGWGPGCTISDPDFCLAGDDRIGSGSLTGAGLLCEDTGPGDADDAEIWQMTYNVPSPLVVALEPNIFSGQREVLGRTNLLTSFRSSGRGERSADTGNVHRSRRNDFPQPGAPV